MFWNDGDSEPNDLAAELMARAGDGLDEDLESVGLYVDNKYVIGRSTPAGPEVAVVLTAVIGRVAFGERVQQPGQEAVDVLFDEIRDNMVDAEYEERRRGLDD